jgi:hypothetical protein
MAPVDGYLAATSADEKGVLLFDVPVRPIRQMRLDHANSCLESVRSGF